MARTNTLVHLLVLIAAFLFAEKHSCAQAPQITKAEAKAWAAAQKKPSVKAYEKFLAKFPDGHYCGVASRCKDSLLLMSIDKADQRALENFLEQYPKSSFKDDIYAILDKLSKAWADKQTALEAAQTAMEAQGWLNLPKKEAVGLEQLPYIRTVQFRSYGKEYVFVANTEGATINCMVLEINADGSCNVAGTKQFERYSIGVCGVNNSKNVFGVKNSENSAELVRVGGKQKIYFSYASADKSAFHNCEYILNLVSPDLSAHDEAAFYGRLISGSIEGRSPEMMAQGGRTQEQVWLLNKMDSIPALVTIKAEDENTDTALAWWHEKNPHALTNAKNVVFGGLPADCSMVRKWKKADIISSPQYEGAIIDDRGFRNVVLRSTSKNEFYLLWSEPIGQNKNTGKSLTRIEFSNGGNITFIYYNAKRISRMWVNVAKKTVTRQ